MVIEYLLGLFGANALNAEQNKYIADKYNNNTVAIVNEDKEFAEKGKLEDKLVENTLVQKKLDGKKVLKNLKKLYEKTLEKDKDDEFKYDVDEIRNIARKYIDVKKAVDENSIDYKDSENEDIKKYLGRFETTLKLYADKFLENGKISFSVEYEFAERVKSNGYDEELTFEKEYKLSDVLEALIPDFKNKKYETIFKVLAYARENFTGIEKRTIAEVKDKFCPIKLTKEVKEGIKILVEKYGLNNQRLKGYGEKLINDDLSDLLELTNLGIQISFENADYSVADIQDDLNKAKEELAKKLDKKEK